MSAYLQRLLDRSAGLAARDSAALQPAVPSQSPILAFDQRLGDPELAADFGLLGASPDEPPPMDEPLAGLDPSEPAPPGRAPAATKARQAIPASRSAPAPTPMPEADSMVAPPSIPRPSRAEPAKAPVIPGREPVVEARPSREPRIGPPKARFEPPSEPVIEPPPRVRERAVPAPEPILRPTESRAAPPHVPPRSEATPASGKARPPAEPALRPSSEPAVRPTPAPTVPDAAIAPPRPADAPAPVAEPIVARPEAVLPPPQHMRRQDIDALVREAVRAETARQRTLPAPPAPVRQTALEDAPREPARRPATASEASVIGPLGRSSFNPMLFGVRRR